MVFEPLPQDDPKQCRPNIELASDRLGWALKVAVREGLQDTIVYFDKVLKPILKLPTRMRSELASIQDNGIQERTVRTAHCQEKPPQSR